jgi:chromate reductase
MRVLGISGSLRRGSHNTALLRAAARRLPAGAGFELFTGLADVPPYNEDDDVGPGPAAVGSLREAVRQADAVLIATPEYNHSIPGQLKNALDWVSRPAGQSALRAKPVAVIGSSTGMFGAVWAQAEARKVAAAIGAQVIDTELPVGHVHQLVSDVGEIELGPELLGRLDEILAELIGAAEQSELQPLAA